MLVKTIGLEPVEGVDNRLHDPRSQCRCLSCEDTAEQVRLREDEERTKCLVICADIPEKVTKTQRTLFEDHSHGPLRDSRGLKPPRQILANALHEGQEVLTDTIMGLDEHFQDKKLQELPRRGSKASSRDTVIRSIFEDVSAGEGASQLILASKDIILARRVTAGVAARQWLGHMSDDTLQHLSHTFGT
jgi:hypothetical protein